MYREGRGLGKWLRRLKEITKKVRGKRKGNNGHKEKEERRKKNFNILLVIKIPR
jgi:hypothetical protein